MSALFGPRGDSRGIGRRSSPLQRWGGALGLWWEGLGERERRLVSVAAVVVGGALLWALAIQPAWTLVRQAPARLDAADAQTLAMQRLATESRELRGTAALTQAQSVAALKAASARLNGARLTIQGDRAVLTVEGLDGEALRSWLAEVRSGARARPVEAQLSRGTQGFNGTLTLTMGAGS